MLSLVTGAALAWRAGDLGGDVDEQLVLVVVPERRRQEVELFGGEAASVLERAASGVGDGAEEEAGGSAPRTVAEGVDRVEEDGLQRVGQAVRLRGVVRSCSDMFERQELGAFGEVTRPDANT